MENQTKWPSGSNVGKEAGKQKNKKKKMTSAKQKMQ
jgi:hypothetical protein